MARHLWPSGVHVSLLIVDGGISLPTADTDPKAPTKLDPADIATTAHFLTKQPRSAWSFEVDVRPALEPW